MRRFIVRAMNVMLRPDREWAAIARERHSWAALCCYLAPLALIAPFAYCSSVLLGDDGAWRAFADTHAALRFALLVVIILVATMHSTFLFDLGVHHVLEVPRRDAAESVAIIVAAGIALSTVAGYYASAAGLFPHR